MEHSKTVTNQTAVRGTATRETALTGMLAALTVVMLFTPIGRIPLPIVSVTIAHIPILIAAICLGVKAGLITAFIFGGTSLFIALTAPGSILDPFFVNPLISILPRMMIPLTTCGTLALCRLMTGRKTGTIHNILSIVVGNLTNTFGVYLMLYVIYAQAIFEKTGKSALSLIITAVSTSTAIKCVIVVMITAPLAEVLQRMMRQ
ncbi:MAG: ECF transporter S component [Lachnospiraceae bacterium]